MARIDDKVRYHIERFVPQLREFEAKEIFSKDEIRTIVKKKTEHERTILSPGCKPADVIAYIDWEIALERLRAKRCNRLKIRQTTSHAAQARIFQIFERGVSRHPGSGLLWRQYLDYAGQVKATKRWRRVMTRALRMLPGYGELWIMAGRRASHEGDMETARSIFMRGCRFCTTDPSVWIEFARTEMTWLSALEQGKGKRLLPVPVTPVAQQRSHAEDIDYQDGIQIDDEEVDSDNDFGSQGFADKLQAGSIMPVAFGQETPNNLESASALAGAIPLAIFDSATSEPFFGPATAEAFFDMLSSFAQVTTQTQVLQHVLETMDRLFPEDAATWICRAKLPLLGLALDSPSFPIALRASLGHMQRGSEKTNGKDTFMKKCVAFIDTLLDGGSLDEGIRDVLENTKQRLADA